jgi:hypothetical protein
VDALDRILSSESDEMLEPSSGFAASAMRAVREAAAEPPPLPFPWGRLAVGFGACSALTAAGATLALRADVSLATLPALGPQLALIGPELAYAAAAILGSVCTLLVARALAKRYVTDSHA